MGQETEFKVRKDDKDGIIGVYDFIDESEELLSEASSPGNCSPMDCSDPAN
jgi:hypothetical protein